MKVRTIADMIGGTVTEVRRTENQQYGKKNKTATGNFLAFESATLFADRFENHLLSYQENRQTSTLEVGLKIFTAIWQCIILLVSI